MSRGGPRRHGVLFWSQKTDSLVLAQLKSNAGLDGGVGPRTIRRNESHSLSSISFGWGKGGNVTSVGWQVTLSVILYGM